MPYIKNQDEFRTSINPDFKTPGELNFSITYLINTYIHNKGLNYQTINDIIGALEGSKLEFYRRIVVPYENLKITQNGDVYDDVYDIKEEK